MIGNFIRKTLPRVERELNRWRNAAKACPDPVLRTQALNSIRDKRFHAQGGSVYSILAGSKYEENILAAVVALQTISDYLDNLCDRTGCLNMEAFKQLHFAVTDALTFNSPLHEYYEKYPYKKDGGYLCSLVRECRRQLAFLPSYRLVQPACIRLASLYNNLQIYKHTSYNERVPLMKKWIYPYLVGEEIFKGCRVQKNFPLKWWEFAAASGSTLCIFALMAAAAKDVLDSKEIGEVMEAYFPWICGLHILLDYFIDQDEDKKGCDLNLVSFYPDEETKLKRIKFFAVESLSRAGLINESFFHTTVVEGLLAMYLSDPKVKSQGFDSAAACLLRLGGPSTLWIYRVCKLMRRIGWL